MALKSKVSDLASSQFSNSQNRVTSATDATEESGDSLKTEYNEWLTTEEAADYLRVSVQVLRVWTSNGKLPFYKLFRSNRYKLTELRELLLSNRKGGSCG